MSIDGIKWHAFAKVFKWDADQTAELAEYLGRQPQYADFQRLGVKHSDYAEADGNLLTTAGLNRITNLIIGGGGTALTAGSRAMAGVGDSATAATVSDAALGGNSSTHSWWQAMDGSNPTQSNGVITGNTTYATGDGNFAWNEWGWGIATTTPVASAVFATATTTGVLLNHKVQSLGTKSAGSTWTLQATITLS